MGDIAMAAKPVAKAVIGALIVVLGLVCVLNLSSEEQIRVEDKVVAQVGGDQDDLTPAEKNLIAAASSHKITPAQQTQLKKEQQATEAMEVPSGQGEDALTDSEKALIAAANNEVFPKPKPKLLVPPLPTDAHLSKKMRKAMKKITEAATHEAVSASTKVSLHRATQNLAVKNIVKTSKVSAPMAKRVVVEQVKRLTKKQRLAREAQTRRQHIEVDDQARQLIVAGGSVSDAASEESIAVHRIHEKMKNLKVVDTWARMKAKIDQEAAADAKKPKKVQLTETKLRMPPVSHKKKHIQKVKKTKKMKKAKTVQVKAKKVEKVHVNVKKSKEPEMDASMEAEYNKWVQHSIKHDAKKEIKKEKRADKKADAKTKPEEKHVVKKADAKTKPKDAHVPSLKTLEKEAEQSAEFESARQVLDLEMAA